MPRGKPNYIDPIRKGATFNVTVPRQKQQKPVVYFVQAENGRIKIGNTKYLADRIASLRFQSPIAIEFLVAIPGARKLEFEYHARFAAHRLHGEWFEPHPDILAEIERLRTTFPLHSGPVCKP